MLARRRPRAAGRLAAPRLASKELLAPAGSSLFVASRRRRAICRRLHRGRILSESARSLTRPRDTIDARPVFTIKSRANIAARLAGVVVFICWPRWRQTGRAVSLDMAARLLMRCRFRRQEALRSLGRGGRGKKSINFCAPIRFRSQEAAQPRRERVRRLPICMAEHLFVESTMARRSPRSGAQQLGRRSEEARLLPAEATFGLGRRASERQLPATKTGRGREKARAGERNRSLNAQCRPPVT